MGWVVLSGGHTPGSAIRAQALRRAMAYGGVAYIGMSEDSGDATLDDMEDLGAPTGYHVNVRVLDDQTLREQIAEASVIVLDEHEDPARLHASLQGAAMDAIREAYQRGAVVLAEGASASLLGRYLFTRADSPPIEGFNWLENSLILPENGLAISPEAVQDVLSAQPEALAVRIGAGSALVLGYDGAGGTIEIWGRREVRLLLGQGYSRR